MIALLGWLRWAWSLVSRFLPHSVAPVPSLPPDVPVLESHDYYLTKRDMAKIKAHRADYMKAVALEWPGSDPETAWLLLVPLHYAESGLSDKEPEPGCGVFALDRRDKTSGDVRAANEAFAHKVCALFHLPDATVSDSFLVASLCACAELSEKVQGRMFNGAQVDHAVLADAYWGYNGRGRFAVPYGVPPDPPGQTVNRHWRHACYVVNDPKHGVLLRQHGTLPGKNPGDPPITIDNVGKNPGTLIVYRELLERRAELA